MRRFKIITGPFSSHLETSITSVIDSLERLYPTMTFDAREDFYDFHIEITTPRLLRRWLRPQALFFFDGKQPFKPLPLEQAFPMFEWGLNWCITQHCHQFLIIHAAVVAKDDAALLLPGQPGMGKSTLCAALIHRGWRLLSDELALVSLRDGQIIPLARPVCLKNDSIGVIQNFAPDAVFGNIVHDTAKGSVTHVKAPDQSIQNAHKRAKPAWIVLPRYMTGSDCILNDRKKGQTFMELARLSFNYNLLALDGFNALSTLIADCACLDLRYSCLDEAVAVLDQLDF